MLSTSLCPVTDLPIERGGSASDTLLTEAAPQSAHLHFSSRFSEPHSIEAGLASFSRRSKPRCHLRARVLSAAEVDRPRRSLRSKAAVAIYYRASSIRTRSCLLPHLTMCTTYKDKRRGWLAFRVGAPGASNGTASWPPSLRRPCGRPLRSVALIGDIGKHNDKLEETNVQARSSTPAQEGQSRTD